MPTEDMPTIAHSQTTEELEVPIAVKTEHPKGDLRSSETLLEEQTLKMDEKGDERRGLTDRFPYLLPYKEKYDRLTKVQRYGAVAVVISLLVIIIIVSCVSGSSSDATSSRRVAPCDNCTSADETNHGTAATDVKQLNRPPADETTHGTTAADAKQLKWFEIGPLAELSDATWEEVEDKLQGLKEARVAGVFVASSLTRLQDKSTLERCANLTKTASALGIKIMLDVEYSYKEITDDWFDRSERRESPYDDYFVWGNGTGGDPPNNWLYNDNTAWSWSETRQQYYLHQHADGTADLNFRNEAVKQHVADSLQRWMNAGVAGVRLPNVRKMLVDAALKNDIYSDLKNCSQSCDQPGLGALLSAWSKIVKNSRDDALFTVGEDVLSPVGLRSVLADPERNSSLVVDLPCGPPVFVADDSDETRNVMKLLGGVKPHPAVKIEHPNLYEETWMVGMMLPATPIFTWQQLGIMFKNKTFARREVYNSVLDMRLRMLSGDYVEPYEYDVVSIRNEVVAFSRWRSADGGYVVVLKPRVDLTEPVNLGALQGVKALGEHLDLTVAAVSNKYAHINLTSHLDGHLLTMQNQGVMILSFGKA